MSFFKRRKREAQESEAEIVPSQESETPEMTRELAPAGTTSPLAPAEMLGKKIVKVHEFEGLKPVKLGQDELDPKTDLKFVPPNTWVWIEDRDIYGHDDGTAVVLDDKEAYLQLPRHTGAFGDYLRVLKIKAGNTFVLACDKQRALASIRGRGTNDWSGSLIRGDAYPVVELTDEMKAGAPEA